MLHQVFAKSQPAVTYPICKALHEGCEPVKFQSGREDRSKRNKICKQSKQCPMAVMGSPFLAEAESLILEVRREKWKERERN